MTFGKTEGIRVKACKTQVSLNRPFYTTLGRKENLEKQTTVKSRPYEVTNKRVTRRTMCRGSRSPGEKGKVAGESERIGHVGEGFWIPIHTVMGGKGFSSGGKRGRKKDS